MKRILSKAQIKTQIGRLEVNDEGLNNEVVFIAKSFFNYYLSQYDSDLTDMAILDIFEEDVSNTFRIEIVTAFMLLPVMKEFYDRAEEVKDAQYRSIHDVKPKTRPASSFNSTVSSKRDTSSYSSSSAYCGGSSSSSASSRHC